MMDPRRSGNSSNCITAIVADKDPLQNNITYCVSIVKL